MAGITPCAKLFVTISSLFIFPKPIFFFKSCPFSFHFPRLTHSLGAICHPRLEPQTPQLNKWHVPKIKSLLKILAHFFKNKEHFIHFLAGMRRTGSFLQGELFPIKSPVGVCVEGGNSTDVTLPAHISNTNSFLHTSRYSNNHRKKNLQQVFGTVCYLETSPELPPHISVPTGTSTPLQEHLAHGNSWR